MAVEEPLKKTYQVCIPPLFLYFFYFLNIIFLCILFSNFLIAIVTHSHLTNSFHVLWGWSRRIKSGGNVWSFPECDMSKEYLTRHKVCFVDCVRLHGSGYAMPLPQCLKNFVSYDGCPQDLAYSTILGHQKSSSWKYSMGCHLMWCLAANLVNLIHFKLYFSKKAQQVTSFS